MPGHGEKKSRKQDAAVAALLTHGTIGQAAQAVGIDETTLRRWLKDPAFQQVYSQARADLLQDSLGHVAEGLVHGALVLRRVLQDAEAGASAKVAAVRLLYDLAFKDRELEAFETRLAALEAALAYGKEEHIL
jgi:transposase-like protein